MNRTFHSWTMYVIFSFSWLLFDFNQTNPRLHLVQHVWPVIIKCSDKMNCKSLCSWQHLQNHQQDDHCTLSFLFQADCWVPLDSTSALCRVSADSLHPSNPATITNQLIVVLLSHWTLRQFSLPLIALIVVAIMQVLTRISRSVALAVKRPLVCRNRCRVRTCDRSSQLSLRMNLLVRGIRRDRILRSRSSSRSTYSFAKLVAIELKYSLRSCLWSHDRVEILVAIMFVIAWPCPVNCDLRRDRTCKGLTDRRSAIKAIGKLEHSHAASFSRLHECNSASRSSQPFSGLEVHNFTSATRLLVVSCAYMGLKRGC